jgi:WD40 repeat protein
LSQQNKTGHFDYPSPQWDDISDPAIGLLDRMISVEVSSRPTIGDCLKHPWMSMRHLSFKTAHVLNYHTNEVWHVAFSHDGSLLATAGRDCKVIIYQVGTFQPIWIIEEHKAAVTWLSWSPDDSKIISCSQDMKVIVWDVQVSMPRHLLDI